MNAFDNNELFRAYAPAGEKNPLVPKYKGVPDDELPSFADINVDEVRNAVGFLKGDVIVVDVDDGTQAELLFDVIEAKDIACLVIQTTRGLHFYFKNSNGEVNKQKQGIKTAIGIEVDYRIDIKGQTGTAKIKQDGRFREILWDLYEGENLAEIPKFLFPTDSNVDFFHMGEGDGRNQSLFNHILTLQKAGLSNEETKETIHLINDYILPEPLGKQEIETILRKEAFQKPVFFNGKKFLFDSFAKYLVNEHSIKRINGRLHIYDEGVYIPNLQAIEASMIKHIPTLSKAQRNEVLSYIELLAYENTKPSPPNYILFRNGVLNVETDELTENDPSHIFTNKIEWDYNARAYSELADNTLNKIACGDLEIRKLLEECIGSTFYRSNTLGGGKAFMLVGDRSNGKSTFLDVIHTLLGEDDISSLDLKELDERFMTAELFGKLANIGDDISNEYLKNTSVFKKLVTGERLSAEKKGQDPFEFNNYSKLLFSANDIPRFGQGSDSGAVARRLSIIPFNASFSKDDEDYNPTIKYDLRQQGAMEYFINIGIEGLKRVLNKKQYTQSKIVDDALESFEVSNDPLQSFLDHRKEIDEPITHIPIRETLYKEYKIYCELNNHHPYSQRSFTSRTKKKLNLETKQVRAKVSGKDVRDTAFID